MFDLGGGELLLILVAVLILFGPKKLPELAQGLGKGLRQFRQAQREFTEQINTAFEDQQRQQKSELAKPGAINTIARSPGGPIVPEETHGIGEGVKKESEEREKGESEKRGEGESENETNRANNNASL